MNKYTLTLLWLLTASCLSAPSLADTPASAPPETFPYTLEYKLGDTEFAPGDSIKIEALRGTTNAIQLGGTYCVTGTYTLGSQDSADLCFYTTTTNRVSVPVGRAQTLRIQKGAGSFRLIQKMTEPGYLHVTFYSRSNGQGFGGVYFGQDPWVLRDKQFSYLKPASKPAGAAVEKPLSLSGPNQTLFNYLGNPVPAPAKLDPAYTKTGLRDGIQGAAQTAEISLARLEIDDSEFPFLVGVAFSKRGDMEKLKNAIRKLDAYTFSGGIGGDDLYIMNIVPSRVFPTDRSQGIYHRMMLREAVLYDKMANSH